MQILTLQNANKKVYLKRAGRGLGLKLSSAIASGLLLGGAFNTYIIFKPVVATASATYRIEKNEVQKAGEKS